MRRLMIPAAAVAALATSVACGPRAGTLEAANDALGAAQITSIQFSGNGRWYQFGQAPGPTLPWPQFDVSSYTATVDYGVKLAISLVLFVPLYGVLLNGILRLLTPRTAPSL